MLISWRSTLMLLLLLSSTAFAFKVYDSTEEEDAETVLSAHDARKIILTDIYWKHSTAINWWVHYINDKVAEQSESGNACALIDITVANWDVQGYLAEVYEQAGYYRVENVPGWDKVLNKPDGKTYLSLSW